MKITEITVSAGRTFNDPNEQFSNFRPQVTLKAVIDDGEDVINKTRELQSVAEYLVEENKQILLDASNKKREELQRKRDEQLDPNLPF